MVTVISNKALYEGGLLEGDTIISIDDAPIPPTHDAMLDWDPGQVVRLIWIRPGTGRMAAEVKLIHNE